MLWAKTKSATVDWRFRKMAMEHSKTEPKSVVSAATIGVATIAVLLYGCRLLLSQRSKPHHRLIHSMARRLDLIGLQYQRSTSIGPSWSGLLKLKQLKQLNVDHQFRARFEKRLDVWVVCNEVHCQNRYDYRTATHCEADPFMSPRKLLNQRSSIVETLAT
jgi:hypothetical protein